MRSRAIVVIIEVASWISGECLGGAVIWDDI